MNRTSYNYRSELTATTVAMGAAQTSSPPPRRAKRKRRRQTALAILSSLVALMISDEMFELGYFVTPENEIKNARRELCGTDRPAAAASRSRHAAAIAGDGGPNPFPYSLWRRMFSSARRLAEEEVAEGACEFTDYVYTLTNAAMEAQAEAAATPAPFAPPPTNPGDPPVSPPTKAPTTPSPIAGGWTGGSNNTGAYINVNPIVTDPINDTDTSGGTTTTTTTVEAGTVTTGNTTNPITSPLPPPGDEPYTANLVAPEKAPADNVAYVLTVATCPHGPLSGESLTNQVFYDAFSMLRHSICNCSKSNTVHDNVTDETIPISAYDSTMYALVHSQAQVCPGPDSEPFDMVASLQGMGYYVKIYDEAIYHAEVFGSNYIRLNMEVVYGARELVQLHSYGLTEHEIVVVVDSNTMVLQPLDSVFDQFMNNTNLLAAYTSKEDGSIDTGMMVIRPSLAEVESIKNTYTTTEFDDINGWGNTGIGATPDGMGVEAFLTYYYKSLLPPEATLELDRCTFGNSNELACRDTPIDDIKIARLTPDICGQPWNCEYESRAWDNNTEALCSSLLEEWSRKRVDFEENHWGNPSAAPRSGGFHTELFKGYCNGEGAYNFETMLGLTTTTSLFTLADVRGSCADDPSRYNICLDVHVSGGNSAWTNALTLAKYKWEMAVNGDLEPVVAPNDPEFTCDGGMPKIIDDIYICAKDSYIDGVGGVLGYAQPRYRRGTNRLPITGGMHFDLADIEQLITDNVWNNVVRHEMAHIFGIGSLWEELGLVTSEPPYEYTGASGCATWQVLSGCPAGSCPPIEHDGGDGTAGSHWDEEQLDTEIMTGWASNVGNDPISILTIGSLEDLGYNVNYEVSDPYTVPEPIQCTSRRRLSETNSFFNKLKGSFRRKRSVRRLAPDGRLLISHDQLSQEGLNAATQHGKNILAKAKATRDIAHDDGSGAVFIGHLYTDVWYKENGVIYLVDVIGECDESGQYCEVNTDCCSKVCNADRTCQ